MAINLGNNEPPAAVRATTPGWRDPRLWIGVALVTASVVVGARVVGRADDSVAMWAVAADLAPGDTVESSDLTVTRVRFADAADREKYFTTDDPLPSERHLLRPVGAGELLPRAVLGASDDEVVHVSVSVPGPQVPPSVRAGSTVDLWVTPPPGSAETTKARLVVSGVVVVEAPGATSDFGAASAERQLVLGVPDSETDLARVLTASGAGRLMLVGRG